MSHYALYGEDELWSVGKYLFRRLPKYDSFMEVLNTWRPGDAVTGPRVGIRTALAVEKLLTDQNSEAVGLMGILQKVIEWGGDTDSVAAIAWGIASTRMTEDVPEFLERDLEPGGKFGAAYLKELGAKLMTVV